MRSEGGHGPIDIVMELVERVKEQVMGTVERVKNEVMEMVERVKEEEFAVTACFAQLTEPARPIHFGFVYV